MYWSVIFVPLALLVSNEFSLLPSIGNGTKITYWIENYFFGKFISNEFDHYLLAIDISISYEHNYF